MSLPLEIKRDYRAVSYSLLSAVVGVILMRIIVYFVPTDGSYGASLAVDALFALPTQLIFFLAIPFSIYAVYTKRGGKQTIEFSGFKGFKPYHLIALVVGVCVFVMTVGISSAWSALLEMTGYNPPTSGADKPAEFVFGFFAAEMIMTAVLPCICEEFLLRGGTLKTAQNTLGTIGCVVFSAIAFGLFHQNIRQFFYTALMGAFAAYLTIKMKSIYPAVFIHFANNFCSVYIDYATEYGFAFGGGFYDFIGGLSQDKPWALFLIFVAVVVVGGGLTFVMMYLRERKIIENKMEIIKNSGFDSTNNRVVLVGEFDEKNIEDAEMEKEVYGADYQKEKYRPSLRDIAIVIALGVTTLLTTVFTYVWGFFY